MIEKAIGNRIKHLRLSKQYLNQEEFAEKLGCDKSYLSRVESGKVNITIESLLVICKGLGVTFSDFFRQSIFKINGSITNEKYKSFKSV